VGRDIPCGAQALVELIEKRRQTEIGLRTSDESIIQEHKPLEELLRDPEARLLEIGDLLHKGLITADEYHQSARKFFRVFRMD
jgi:hypothetical protein